MGLLSIFDRFRSDYYECADCGQGLRDADWAEAVDMGEYADYLCPDCKAHSFLRFDEMTVYSDDESYTEAGEDDEPDYVYSGCLDCGADTAVIDSEQMDYCEECAGARIAQREFDSGEASMEGPDGGDWSRVPCDGCGVLLLTDEPGDDHLCADCGGHSSGYSHRDDDEVPF